MTGQLRIVSGMKTRIVGIDLNVAFTMGAALGVPALLIAEWMPAIEAVMVEKLNEAQESRDEDV